MRRMSFKHRILPLAVATAMLPTAVAAQDQATVPILSSDISVSRESAELRLELQDGRTVVMRLGEGGEVLLNDQSIGEYERRDALDRAWRDLLQTAMDAPTGQLSDVLVGWSPPGGTGDVGQQLDQELEAALAPPAPATAAAPDAPAAAPGSPQHAVDSITLLNQRIRALEQALEDPEALEGLRRLEELRALGGLESLEQLEQLEEIEALDLSGLRELRSDLERDLRQEIEREMRVEVNAPWNRARSPWRHIANGLGGVFSTMMTYAILIGLGFLAVFFGRKYLERIADTARQQTLRSGLVGLAGSFLVLPAYILGLLALAISIVGIPLILVFAPLFPVAVVLAALGGYLAVAHGAGEALAERRFTGTDWFSRANSYYYMLTGVGLLLVLYLAAHIVSMAGPWLDFLEGLLLFMAVMLTWAAFTIGFGAFLISRGGTRPPEGVASPLSTEPESEINV